MFRKIGKCGSSAMMMMMSRKPKVILPKNEILLPDGTRRAKSDLDQIVKMDLLEREEAPVVAEIWTTYHHHQTDLFSAVLPVERYEIINQRAKRCPMFLLPVFKSIGYMNCVAQFQPANQHSDHKRILLTSLREFQRAKEFATPAVTVNHYTDFASTKGIVLMRGEININLLMKEFNKGEADQCIRNLYDFYSVDKLFHEFVEVFNKNPTSFRFEHFLEVYKKKNPPQNAKVLVTDKDKLQRIQEKTEKEKEETHYNEWFYSKFQKKQDDE